MSCPASTRPVLDVAASPAVLAGGRSVREAAVVAGLVWVVVGVQCAGRWPHGVTAQGAGIAGVVGREHLGPGALVCASAVDASGAGPLERHSQSATVRPRQSPEGEDGELWGKAKGRPRWDRPWPWTPRRTR